MEVTEEAAAAPGEEGAEEEGAEEEGEEEGAEEEEAVEEEPAPKPVLVRARWLASQGFVLGGEGGRGVLAYVPPQVSGENRLLLGVAPRAGVGV